MVHYASISPPSPRTLLPPLLACLPSSFASPHPPPALYTLLSPTLRQRVRYLATPASSTSTNSSHTSTNSWLPLLCRQPAPAQRLVDIVSESDAFELHPVSGEIDFGEVEPLRYRRLDEETLQCRVGVPELGLLIIYLWCQGDAEAGDNGWRVCEVWPLGDDDEGDDGTAWSATMMDADEAARDNFDTVRQDGKMLQPSNGIASHNRGAIPSIIGPVDGADDDDGENDYWAQYDKTPGQTPALTPGAKSSPLLDQVGQARMTSEADHYAQYAQVQPEMDSNDPSRDRGTMGESTLNGDVLTSVASVRAEEGRSAMFGTHDHRENHEPYGIDSKPGRLMNDLNIKSQTNGHQESFDGINHPAAATSGPSIQQLQGSAELQSIAEVAIKQHVGASIKSLFRLCRSTGMDTGEFDEMIREELEVLKMMNDE